MLLQTKLSGSRCYAKVNSPGARWCTKLHFWCKNWHFNTQTANWFICSAPIDPPPSLDRRVTVHVGAVWLLVYYTSVHYQSRRNLPRRPGERQVETFQKPGKSQNQWTLRKYKSDLKHTFPQKCYQFKWPPKCQAVLNPMIGAKDLIM